MNKQIKRIQMIGDKFYQIIMINTIFLVVNCLFFQIYFSMDFKLVFFPVYAVVSITLLPSIAILRRVLFEVDKGIEGSLLLATVKNIQKLLKKEWKSWLLVHVLFCLIVTNLYILTVTNFVTLVLYVANIFFACSWGVYVINLLRYSTEYIGRELFYNSAAYLLSNTIINLVLAAVVISILVFAMNVSFISIIVIFGLLLKMSMFENHIRKGGIIHGVSNK